jgi:aurora kinase
MIIHRDIKLENLLISEDGTLKLADFGWSNFGNGNASDRKTYCGTPDYLAPEMVNETGHTEKLDIWCVGILLFEILVGRTPF